MSRRRIMRVLFSSVMIIAATVFGSVVCGADGWYEPDAASAGVNDDCGMVSGIWGGVKVRGQFLTAKDSGVAPELFERVNGGNEIETADNGRIEIVTGNNTVSLIGPNSKVKIVGVRLFTDGNGKSAMRLAIELQQGVVRVQVRLNAENPESVSVDAGGVSALVMRGDAVVSGGSDWKVSALAGTALYRTAQGAPTHLTASETGSLNGGVTGLPNAEAAALATSLPFSFDISRATLRPSPPPNPLLEAP